MSANNITQLCQVAARNFLRNEGLSFIADVAASIRSGITSEDIGLPVVVCQCLRAQAAVPFEGNWSAALRIEVRSNADDDPDGAKHHENAGELFAKFMTATAAVDMSGLAGFTAQFVLPVEQGWDLNDRSWVSFLSLQVECCGSDFDIT